MKANILANLIARFWVIGIGILFIPLYLRFLGLESYGLIGFFGLLVGISSLLDFGLGAALNREIARQSSGTASDQDQLDLVRTVEIVFWIGSAAIGAIIVAISPIVASDWVRSETISHSAVETSVTLMGLAIIFQLPFNLYQSGLMGLQRQVLLSVILIVFSTVRGVGSVLTLWFVSPTIEAYFSWQIIVNICAVFFVGNALRSSLPVTKIKPRFRKRLLVDARSFAAGWTGNAFLNVVLGQVDKIILSKFLNLEGFAYYTLAQTVAGSLWAIIGSVTSAAFPKFATLVAQSDLVRLRALYRESSQAMAVLLIPTAVVLIVFAADIMSMWTRDESIAEHTRHVLGLLTCGVMFGGVASVPVYLQLAYNWFGLTIRTNIAMLFLSVPLIGFLCTYFGVVGAASGAAIVSAGMVVTVPFMHSKVLVGEFAHWAKYALVVPACVGASIVVAAKVLMPATSSIGLQASYVLGAWIVAVSMTAAVLPDFRPKLLAAVFQWWRQVRTRGT